MKNSDTVYTVTDACVWPERRGMPAHVVKPNPIEAKRYPWAGLGKDEVVVFIPNDPIDAEAEASGRPFAKPYQGWTCVMRAEWLVSTVMGVQH